MADFLAALGLVLVIEGLVYGGLPGVARRMAEEVRQMPESTLRIGGLVAMVMGVVLVWLVCG